MNSEVALVPVVGRLFVLLCDTSGDGSWSNKSVPSAPAATAGGIFVRNLGSRLRRGERVVGVELVSVGGQVLKSANVLLFST